MKFFALFAAVLAIAAAAPTTQWTLEDLSQAIENPATPYALRPYLEQALNDIMTQIFAGESVVSVAVPTPAGLLPLEAIASPAVILPAFVEEPVAPAPVVEPTPAAVIADAAGSPLVQIIVNIKSEAAAAAPETPASAVEPSPTPVIVVDGAVQPEPVVIAPTPVVVVPGANPIDIIAVGAPEAISPTPVIVVPEANPIDIIAVGAPEVIAPTPVVVVPGANPVDIIAVGAPEVNPIDLLQPVPVAVPAGASQGILV